MTAPAPDPQVSAEFAAKALVHASAIQALVEVGCESCLDLFVARAEKSLRAELETGEIYCVNERGEKRHGVSPSQLAAEIRAKYDAGRNMGRFFKQK